MTTKRVLIVDDSLTIRHRLAEVLAGDSAFEVVGEARDGREAIALCRELRPDVITMDMMLPVMTGLGATEYIMAHCPTPILVVSSSFNRGEIFKTYDALAAGAVDVIEKPTGREPVGSWETSFLSALRVVSRVRVITHLRGRLNPTRLSTVGGARVALTPGLGSERNPPRVVVIGASTGGPSALVELLSALPPTFRTPILIVLHIGAPFAAPFAEWLSAQSSRPVAYARGGETLGQLGGRVTLAPVNRHLVIRSGRLRLTEDPERHSCRPSVDVLFESVAEDVGDAAIACLLTGMGRDGALGLRALRQAGAMTIAQSEESCAVFGMPREAIQLGAAVEVLPLPDIAPFLSRLTSASEGTEK